MVETLGSTMRLSRRTVVDGRSFGVEPGGSCAFPGCNGTGESTIMRLLTVLFIP